MVTITIMAMGHIPMTEPSVCPLMAGMKAHEDAAMADAVPERVRRKARK